jgi:hypothetical protein
MWAANRRLAEGVFRRLDGFRRITLSLIRPARSWVLIANVNQQESHW